MQCGKWRIFLLLRFFYFLDGWPLLSFRLIGGWNWASFTLDVQWIRFGFPVCIEIEFNFDTILPISAKIQMFLKTDITKPSTIISLVYTVNWFHEISSPWNKTNFFVHLHCGALITVWKKKRNSRPRKFFSVKSIYSKFL